MADIYNHKTPHYLDNMSDRYYKNPTVSLDTLIECDLTPLSPSPRRHHSNTLIKVVKNDTKHHLADTP